MKKSKHAENAQTLLLCSVRVFTILCQVLKWDNNSTEEDYTSTEWWNFCTNSTEPRKCVKKFKKNKKYLKGIKHGPSQYVLWMIIWSCIGN